MSLPVDFPRQPHPAPGRAVSSWPAEQMRRALDSVHDRLRGPGGYYNLGNILGLSVALALHVHETRIETGDLTSAALDFFLGSPAAVSLTFATIIFLVSGEIYRAAWMDKGPAGQQLKQSADLVSAVGAVMLSLSLLLMGHILLAIASGILVAGGKLGSAVTADDPNELPLWPLHWPDPLRGAVLIGRLPGLAVALADFLVRLSYVGLSQDTLRPATLIVCTLLWIRADLMLVDAARFRPPA